MKRTLVLFGLIALMACSSSKPTGTTTTTPSGSASPAAGAEASAFLSKFKEGFAGKTFRVRYALTIGEQQQDITWAQRGSERSFKMNTGGQVILVIEQANGTIVCIGTQSCTRSTDQNLGLASSFVAPLLAFGEQISSINDLPGFVSKGSATVAGRAANCASWSYSGASTDVCADDETGILLSWATSVGGQTVKWNALDFGEPEDADFKATTKVTP